MTALKYIMASGVATSSEIIHLKRDAPQAFSELVALAKQEMEHNGIEVEEPVGK